jgi:hypothetical protein
MSAQNDNPGTVLRHLLDLANGLASKPPGGQTSLVIQGVSITIADLVTEVQGYAAAYQAVEDADLEHQKALAARAAIEAKVRRRRDSVRAAITGALGKMNPGLATYGITPDKEHRPLTVEEEILKVARAKATRAARHTMGKKQKEAIKGQVPPKPAP